MTLRRIRIIIVTKRVILQSLIQTFKKLVLVLVIFALMTKANKEEIMIVKRVFCIYYSIWFKKNNIRALINFDNKINFMSLGYASKWSLKIYYINIKA